MYSISYSKTGNTNVRITHTCNYRVSIPGRFVKLSFLESGLCVCVFVVKETQIKQGAWAFIPFSVPLSLRCH